ncbi:hypothetical protein PIROE2DRAFT_14613 [Piromyces sp. E2]|nr:hypothetical protein PIROE2DRAFT_14613 [Piromyces sp. E2]|eukprot:OUM59777.1 hypothetical protein PIROE2DRAFT_14613 [Piromyces sp. E2]
MVSASLILIGETGNGKSSLGNFILNKEVFSVSDNPESETKITRGEYSDDDNNKIFVIDTPGLQDAEGTDRDHLVQMIDYIRDNPGLQGIVIVFNYHQPRLPLNIKTLIKLLCNVFPGVDFWKHVALVWTKFYYFLPLNKKEKRFNMINKFMPEVLKFVNETNGDDSIHTLPTFFVDSNFEKKDEFSCEEINRLITWVHQLDPIDVEKVVKADAVIQETSEETDIRIIKNIEGNIEHIKTEYYKRNKQIYYDGNISYTYTDWELYDEECHDNILPKELLEVKTDHKTEENYSKTPIMEWRHSRGPLWGLFGGGSSYQVCVGYTETKIIDYFERNIKIFNDNSVEKEEWRKVDSKSITRRL